MIKVVPFPSIDANVMDPSCASTIFLQMASPSPVPLNLVEKYKNFGFILLGNAVPVVFYLEKSTVLLNIALDIDLST